MNQNAKVAEEIATAIRSMREFRGLTQLGLAERMGVTQAFISRLEDPTYKRWSFRTLAKIGTALNCRVRIQFQ